MKPLKILIVEDDPYIAFSLESDLKDMGYFITSAATNSDDALSSFKRDRPDLVIMDIELQGSSFNGIELVEFFNMMPPVVPVIYFTEYNDRYEEAEKTKPIRFISKDFNKVEIQRAIKKLAKEINASKKQISPSSSKDNFFLTIRKEIRGKVEPVVYNINTNDIHLIESDNGRFTITLAEEKITRSGTLKNILEEINHPDLIRIHNRYAINFNKIKKVRKETMRVYLIGQKTSVPIGESFKDNLFDRINPDHIKPN